MAPHTDVGVDIQKDKPFSLDLSMRMLPGAEILRSDIAGLTSHHSSADDTFLLIMGRLGNSGLQFGNGRRLEIRPGAACVAPLDGMWSTMVETSASLVSLALPRLLLDDGQLKHVSEGICLPDSAELRLLQSYATTLLHREMEMSPSGAPVVAAHLGNLALLALGKPLGGTDEMELVRGRAARAARLLAVQADIVANLGHPHFSLDWIARRHRMSPRAIRDMFYGENTSFTDYVLERRLDRMREALVDPRQWDRTITAMAFDAGFGDLSWFYQAFRRRFGITPSAMRERALAGL